MVMEKMAVKMLERLPKNLVSRAFGVVSDVELPRPVQQVVNRSFAELAGINMAEGEHGPGQYDSLNAYFTRRLRAGARHIESDQPDTLVSPVDGRIGAFGNINAGTLLQAKGRTYRLLDLVDSAERAEAFDGGSFMTIYLSPRDYHRIHAPVAGQVDEVSYIPGYLFPVNPFAVRNIDELFAVNERLISYLETEKLGRIGVVKVGATCVGRIGLAFDGFETNGTFRRREDFTPREELHVDHGDELGVFNLGSTVILLISEPDFRFREDLRFGDVVRLGQSLGALKG
ncbi:phosphatidylserine decarboxylase [Lujinxingia litoralis]|uniref:phosphatidylserine decarboxylase n=1 Tax=Lujinxingia litoralis TaxID=2211119 RepID=A0A328CBK8_9DELT|nr:archaetidylserine decarboxylase [Lujinxingia litoralis]RAL25428.1 phosphatidylserine decarboxylase [Lujinxingia litoralis]